MEEEATKFTPGMGHEQTQGVHTPANVMLQRAAVMQTLMADPPLVEMSVKSEPGSSNAESEELTCRGLMA